MTTATLALIAAITIPGTTEHGNIRPRDIVSTNVEQTVDYIVGRKGYATTNQVAIAAKNAKYEAIDTANDYTNEQIDGIQENIERMQTNAKNYTDSATNETLNASKKYTDKMADTLIEMDTRNWTVAVSAAQEYTDKSTNAVLSSAKSYTDSEVSNIIKQIDYPVTSVNGKKGDVNLTSDDIGAVKIDNYQPKNLTEYIESNDANVLIASADYTLQVHDELIDKLTNATNAVQVASKKYTDDAVKGLATEAYVNAKANAAYVGASQNATNLSYKAEEEIQNVYNDLLDAINQNSELVYTNLMIYTDKAIGAIKLPITNPIGSTTNTAISEIKGPLVTDDYFSDIVSELEQEFLDSITSNNNAIFRDYTNKLAVASHDTLTNANAYTDKKVAAIKVTETDPVFENWRTTTSKVNIGEYADGDGVSIGARTYTFDSDAVAIGYQTSAENRAVAIGVNTTASDQDAIAIGNQASTKKPATICLQDELILSSYGFPKGKRLEALYLGDYNLDELINEKIPDTNSFIEWKNSQKISAGSGANISGEGVMAFGPDTSAKETGAIAIGNMTSSSGFLSLALGSGSKAMNDISIAIGAGAISKGAGTIAFIGEDYYAYPNVTLQSKDDRLKTFYLGDYNLDTLIGDKLTAFGNGLDFVKTEEDPKFTAWTNETYKILLGKGATADITESTASAIVIGSGARAGNHSIALGEAIEAGENNIFIGSSINHGDTTNGIVIGNLSGNVSGEPQKFGNVIIGSNAYDYYGDSILIGYGTESHDYGTINIGSEALLTEYGFTNDTEKANALFIGDSSLGNIIYTLLYNELSYWRGKFTVENVAPTVIESGNLYCFRPNSTAATAISLSPTFDNGKEDEAKLYLDYTTARSNITVSDSTITVLYEPNSYKLNAFDAPNGQSNRYIVDLKWFATTATENGTKQKFLIVNAKKVSE